MCLQYIENTEVISNGRNFETYFHEWHMDNTGLGTWITQAYFFDETVDVCKQIVNMHLNKICVHSHCERIRWVLFFVFGLNLASWLSLFQ